MAGLNSVAKVKKLVFDSVFKRALDIANTDSLHNVTFEGDNLETCKAECTGSSGSDVYTLNVSVFGDKAAGKCSCPASTKAKDGLCKHVVALLLRRNDKLQEQTTKSIRVSSEEAELDEYPIENIGSPEDGRETVASPSKEEEIQSKALTLNRSPAPRQSSSRRALPAWMLGVVGSAESEELSKKAKPKRKAAAAKPPRAPPPPTKRARRQGRPLKVLDGEDEDEDGGPGEVEVADPEEEEVEEPVVEDDDNMDPSTSGTRNGQVRRSSHPRSRRNKEVVKQNAGEIESIDGDENVGALKGKTSAQRRSKSRSVVGKVERELSENQTSQSPVRSKGVALEDVTDDDLLLLAQEHVANENGRPSQNSELENKSHVRSEGKKLSEKPVKKTSKFSFDNWKEISSQVDPDALLHTGDGLDLETLKTYSHQADSQTEGLQVEGLFSSQDGVDAAHTSLRAEGANVPASDADKESITNDMLGLIFGSSLSASILSQSQAPREHLSANVDGEELRPVQGSSFETVTASELPSEPVKVPPAAVLAKSKEEPSSDFRPKKKSSLKDKIKMLMD